LVLGSRFDHQIPQSPLGKIFDAANPGAADLFSLFVEERRAEILHAKFSAASQSP
jgi:hypothetical protein